MIIDAAELKRRHLQRLKGVRDNKVYIGPAIICLGIVDKCNLRCRHCWIHSPGNPAHLKESRFLPWERFLGIVDDCVDLNVDQIHLAGEGEPTLHPLFRKIMRHLERQPLNIRLYTNATFPVDYCSDVIKGDQVVINLGAVDRQQYRRIYGRDLFDRVVNNIKRLVALRDSRKPRFLIGISYIVNSLNIGEKQQMQEMASLLGVNSVFFKKMTLHSYNREIALPQTATRKTAKTSLGCSNGWFYLLLKLDSHASICCRIQQMPHCHVDKKSLKDFWFSRPLMYTRLMGKNGYIPKMFKVCQTCTKHDKEFSKTLFPDEQYLAL